MGEVIIGGFDPEPIISPWLSLARQQGMLDPQAAARVDSLTLSSGAEAELLREAATNSVVAGLLTRLGGLSGLREQVADLLAEENGRL